MSSTPRILLIRPSALGDVARTVPVVASLRAAMPDARIDWLVQQGFEDVVTGHPAVDAVIPFPRKQLGSAMRRGQPFGLAAFCKGIRRSRYDVVIDAQGLLRSGLIARMSGARMRIGHADAREGASVLYTHAVRSPAVHTVDRMLDLLGPLGVPAIRDMRLATSESREPGPPPVVIAPTSRWPAKRWPIERFAELTRRVLGLGAGRIVVVGGPGEREQCGPLLRLAVSDPRVEDRVGSTSVAGLVSLIASARLVVANDSAAAHIAVGFDRPLVAMYGPTDITRVGPYRRRDDVLQHLRAGDGFDHKRAGGGAMMARITVEEAVSACRKHLTPSEPVC